MDLKNVTIGELEAALPEMREITEKLMDSAFREFLLQEISLLEQELAQVKPKVICLERP